MRATAVTTWYSEAAGITEEFRVTLRRPGRELSPRPTKLELAEAIGEELRVNRRNGEDALWLMWRLVEPLEAVVAEGTCPIIETRGVRVAKAAAEGLDSAEMERTMKELGWGAVSLPASRVDMNQANLREALVRRLGQVVTNMLIRWEKAGHLDLAKRHERQRAYRRQERRERLTRDAKLNW